MSLSKRLAGPLTAAALCAAAAIIPLTAGSGVAAAATSLPGTHVAASMPPRGAAAIKPWANARPVIVRAAAASEYDCANNPSNSNCNGVSISWSSNDPCWSSSYVIYPNDTLLDQWWICRT